MSRVLVLIPSRFGSTRFPGKPLSKINGQTLISYVVNNMKEGTFDYAIVTDHDGIEKEVKSLGGNVLRVDDEVKSGTARIALAFQRFYQRDNYDVVINLQGDEPFVKAEIIEQIARFHLEKKDFDIATFVVQKNSLNEDFEDPNNVKVVMSQSRSECLYFSRAPIPSKARSNDHPWYKHVGIYSFHPKSLEEFINLPHSPLEDIECLEQLRALENGLSIGACVLDKEVIGIDTPEQIAKAEEYLNAKEG